jgi:hypothetical protein
MFNVWTRTVGVVTLASTCVWPFSHAAAIAVVLTVVGADAIGIATRTDA